MKEDAFKVALRALIGQESADAALRLHKGLPPLPPPGAAAAGPAAAAGAAAGGDGKAKAKPRARAPAKGGAKGMKGAAGGSQADLASAGGASPDRSAGGGAGGAGPAAGGSVRDQLRDDAASAAGIDMAAEAAALLPGRVGGDADVAVGRARRLTSREEWVAATAQRLPRLLVGPAAPCAALRAHAVRALAPGAAAALTAAVVDRLTAALEGVRDARDWRAGRGAGVGVGPPGAVVATSKPLQQVWNSNKAASAAAAQLAATKRAALLAQEEAALKRRRAAAGADAPVSEEDAARAAKIARMKAEDEGRSTADATAAATRAALGGAAASTHDRWAQMERAAERGEDPVAAAAASRAAAAAAAAAAAPPPPPRAIARGVGLRDCDTWLRRDGRASPRLLAAAAERLRRAEQPGVNAASAPPTAPMLGPLTPRWL